MALSILAILLIGTFFITSADSGTFVLVMMTANGTRNLSHKIKVVWGVLLALTAFALLYTGRLQALQNTMIIGALAFSVIMLLMLWSLLKSLNEEAKEFGIGQFKVIENKKTVDKRKKDTKAV